MRRVIFVFLLLGLAAGCARQDLSKPPKIRYGRDVCAECRMIITDPRFASAIVDENGEVMKFDDIGCMQNFTKENNTKPKYAWVHDYETEEWILHDDAILTRSEEIVTPMGYGILAIKRREK